VKPLAKVAAAGVAGLLAMAAAPSAAAPEPRVHTVVMDRMIFGPTPSSVRPGDVILWVNRDMFRHTATARDGSFNVDLAPKESARTVIARAGVIDFYCKYHPGMKGRLNVVR